MSTVKVGTVASQTAATPPVFQDNAAREVGQLCTAWVNFNGTGTVAIKNSFNVSSITDNGVGIYTVNFATAMANVDYAAVAASSAKILNYTATKWYTAGATVNGFGLGNYTTSYADDPDMSAIVFGGL